MCIKLTAGTLGEQILEELLRDWSKGSSNKVLIFTKSIKLLRMLAFHVKSNGRLFYELQPYTLH